MKLSSFVTFIVIVGAIFFCFSFMVNEANQKYPTANINSSKWSTQYDMSSRMNFTIWPIVQKFQVIQDEKQGFFTKLAAGIAAIPYAIIVIPAAIFNTVDMGNIMITSFLTALGIPLPLIIMAMIILVIWAVFKLSEFFQRVTI